MGRLRPTTPRPALSAVGNMLVRRHKHDAVLVRDGRVLITGGADERDDEGVYTFRSQHRGLQGRWAPVPHRQVVLTIPKRRRAYCRYRRAL